MAEITTIKEGRYGFERFINVITRNMLVTYGERTTGDLEIVWMEMRAGDPGLHFRPSELFDAAEETRDELLETAEVDEIGEVQSFEEAMHQKRWNPSGEER